MNQEQRDWIDNASYKDLLRRNRFSSLDDSIFQGLSGTHFMETMRIKEGKLKPGEKTEISKSIGWG